jgi:hypothetical protein
MASSESFADRLGNAQVRKQISELLLGEAFEQALGHQAAAGGEDVFDFGGAKRYILAAERAQDSDLLIAIDGNPVSTRP